MADPLSQDDVLAPPEDPFPENERSQLSAAMTHEAPVRPNPAVPDLTPVRNAFQGGLSFMHGGLTEAFPGLRQMMPEPVNAVGDFFQSQAARDAFSSANAGGVPLIEAVWTQPELAILRKAYSQNAEPSKIVESALDALPGRSRASIFNKANELGITKAPVGPYVRQPGAPAVVKDEEKVTQLMDMLAKGKMTTGQMADRLGVSERTLRRYMSEDLQIRQRGKDIWKDPRRIEQYKEMVAKGWSQNQMAKALGMDVSGVSQQLKLLREAGELEYVPQAGVRTPSMPVFSFAEDDTALGDLEYEKELAAFLARRQAGQGARP